MSARSLTWREVWTRRLAQHSLLTRATVERLVEMVGHVCGIHAQVMSAAELSIGIRIDGVSKSDVQEALWEERTLVKTYGLRGTVHLFPAEELPLWMAALRARAALDPRRYENVGLEPDELKQILEAIGNALDGKQLTLKQLGEEVVRQLGSWAGEATSPAWGSAWPRWRKALIEAALAGLLCYGPQVGNEVTFVRPEQWAEGLTGDWYKADESRALLEVFRRYLHAYGPATTRDFAQWFNIPPRAARELAATCRADLEEVDVEGYRSYMLAEDVAAIGKSETSENLPVRLLPHFDCYVIGCHPRDRLLPTTWAERTPPRTTPSQLQTLLVDGTVAGVWERHVQRGQLEVRVEPFETLDSHRQQLLEEEVGRITAILGLQTGEARLTIGEVAVRPHL